MAINFVIIKSDEIHHLACNHWTHTMVLYNTDVALFKSPYYFMWNIKLPCLPTIGKTPCLHTKEAHMEGWSHSIRSWHSEDLTYVSCFCQYYLSAVAPNIHCPCALIFHLTDAHASALLLQGNTVKINALYDCKTLRNSKYWSCVHS